MSTSHSLFGFVWQISTATGWTINYILWGVSYPLLMTMIADAPRWIKPDEKKKVPGLNPRDKKSDIVNMFQQRFENKKEK
jgi:hypothetical protein